ncbi:hypothetical protein [Ectobacillus antri]|uniref:hypothetical protein n=1 Tax=Ectobacillus antri TaxID=2486280 RepID=UPI000F5A990E|nr:hypothetical protein [Ectobacillus antri]
MPKQYYPLKDFSLGLNDKAAAHLLDDRELAEATNVVLGTGWVSKRNGYEQYATFPAPVRKIYNYLKVNGHMELLVVSDKLYTQDDTICTAIPGTVGNGDRFSMITVKDRSVNDVALIADGGMLKRYNGIDVAVVTPHLPNTQEQENPGLNELGNLSAFRALTMHKGRLYAAAHPVHKNRVSFSHIDPTLGFSVYDYFPAVNFFDIATNDNDEIIELRTFRDTLVIFCRNTIWALYGNTTSEFQLLKINVPTGCVAPKSVTAVENNLFYLSDTHVYALFATDFNTVSAQVISDKVENTLKGISSSEKAKATGVFHENKYYLSFPSGLTLVYDVLLQAWTKYTNIQANTFLVREGRLFFGSENKNVYRFGDVYHDEGQPIPFLLKTKRLDFGSMMNDKKLRRMWIQSKQYEESASGYTIDAVFEDETKRLVSNIINDELFPKWDEDPWDTAVWDAVPHSNPNSAKWDEAVWDSSRWDFLEIQQEEVRIREKSRTLQLVISNDVRYQPVTIYGIEFEYKPRKP